MHSSFYFSRFFLVLVLLALALSGLLPAQPVHAAGFTVNSLADNATADSNCTLREAILATNNTPANSDCGPASAGDDTITFSVSGTITLASTLPTIVSGQGALTIDGDGNITISGSSAVRVMNINSGATLTLQNLTITNGFSHFDGGGIYNNGGTLSVTSSAFSNNSTDNGGGGIVNNTGIVIVTNTTFNGNSVTPTGNGGGGISNWGGTLSVTNSTFSSNFATNGGGIYTNGSGIVSVINSTFSGNSANSNNGGAIYNNSGTLTVINSAFNGNSAYFYGGGIYNASSGTLSVTNSTFSNNTTNFSGSGIFNDGIATLRNTIIANSSGGGDCGTTIALSGTNNNNLIEDSTNACGLTHGVNGNIIGSDPNLGTLTGSPAYFPLNTGSPAIDAGSNADCAAAPVNNQSQNGVTRPQDGNGDSAATCDIGAYELDPTPPSLSSLVRFTPAASPTNADVLVFRATFSEAVQNVDAADFTVTGTTAAVTGVTGVGGGPTYTQYDITVSGGDLPGLNGTVGLDLSGTPTITDLAGNALPAGEPATDETYAVENTAPSLLSFTRFNPSGSTTNADVLVFRAQFSEAVQNVDAADFAINAAPAFGITPTLTVTQVSPSLYEITISGGDLANYNGVIGLNLAGSQNISDLAGNALPVGEPATDETYTVDNAPALVSFMRRTPATSPTNADTLIFRATFSEAVQNVDAADFAVTGTTATVSGVSGVGSGPTYTQYDITVSGGNLASLNGTVGLNLASGQDITDQANNALPAGEPATDETYVVENSYVLHLPLIVTHAP